MGKLPSGKELSGLVRATQRFVWAFFILYTALLVAGTELESFGWLLFDGIAAWRFALMLVSSVGGAAYMIAAAIEDSSDKVEL